LFIICIFIDLASPLLLLYNTFHKTMSREQGESEESSRDIAEEVRTNVHSRQSLRQETDLTLVQIHTYSGIVKYNTDRAYRNGRPVSPEAAQEASNAALNETRSRAVSRERLEDCARDNRSHQRLRDVPGLEPSPKRQGRDFGERVREKRGADE
jgi:hypothetical protein